MPIITKIDLPSTIFFFLSVSRRATHFNQQNSDNKIKTEQKTKEKKKITNTQSVYTMRMETS